MPDLNKIMDDVQKQGAEVKERLRKLLSTYENLFREGNKLYLQERTASPEGLDDFYRLVQTVRRNRDVVGSLLRGVQNMRPISDFRFVEEDISEKKEPEVDIGRVAAMKIPGEVPEVKVPQAAEGGADA